MRLNLYSDKMIRSSSNKCSEHSISGAMLELFVRKFVERETIFFLFNI